MLFLKGINPTKRFRMIGFRDCTRFLVCRRADLAAVVKQRFAVDCHEMTIGWMLWELGFSHVSTRRGSTGGELRFGVIVDFDVRRA